MGRGKIYVCSKCGNRYEVFTGTGALFPIVYRDTAQAVIRGDHGKELQELFLSRNDVALDAASHLYYCDKCGRWEVTEDLSLYARRDGAKVDFAFSIDEDEYALLKRVEHKCPDCGSVMVRDPDIEDLACPYCGTVNSPNDEVMWD